MNIFKTIIPSQNNNHFVYSELKNTEFARRTTPGLGIKYVLSGKETYSVDGKEYMVEANEFLLVNDEQQYAAQITGNDIATGICIQVNNEIINDVHTSLTADTDKLIDEPSNTLSQSITFLNAVSKVHASKAAEVLTRIKMYYNEPASFSEELYYQIASAFVQEHLEVKNQICQLKAKKKYTQEELYRRIKKAKEIIGDCYLQDIDMTEIAKRVNLSKFYFLRTYKQVFHISPYQYLIKKRLQHAMQLLQRSDASIYEVALLSGYCDIHTFSKSFKKEFHIAPSVVNKKG
jgi:AraC-like DNA-binding protein